MADPRTILSLACAAATLAAAGQADIAPRLPGPGPQARVIRAQAANLPWRLQEVRRKMLDDQWVSYADLRALADTGDGLAAFNYAERLVELDDPSVLSAAALYYSTAAFAGRDYAVWELVRLLDRKDIEISDARLENLENAMHSLVRQGSEKARKALLRFYETGHPFGRKPDRAREMLRGMAGNGDPEAALQLATQALSRPDGGDPEELRGLLETAMQADDLGTRATARNLLRQVESRPPTNSKDTTE